MKPNTKKAVLAASIALALGSASAQAALVADVLGPYDWSTDSANFTTLAGNGGVVPGGANDVIMMWDGNAYNASSDYTGPGSVANVNIIASATSPFFGYSWTAHDAQMFVPGSYSFDASQGGGSAESGILNVTVGTGQLGMHLLWDWNGNLNVDVFVVFDQNSLFGAGILFSTEPKCSANYSGTIVKNCLDDQPVYGSAGAPTKNQIWMLATADGNGDGKMGIPTVAGGPAAGFTHNFNANLIPAPDVAVPIPAAMWLFSSGLLSIVGLGYRGAGNRDRLILLEMKTNDHH